MKVHYYFIVDNCKFIVKYVKQYNVNGVVKMEVKVEGEDKPTLSGNNENESDQVRTGGWDTGNNENKKIK